MEVISEIAQYLTSSESIILGLFILIFVVYKKLIEPKLQKLEEFEKTRDQNLENVLTMDDLVKARNDSHDHMVEMLYDKFEDLQEKNTKEIKDYFQDSVQISKEISKENLEQIMVETKKSLEFYSEFLERVEKIVIEHDEKTVNYDSAIIEIIKMLNIIYETLDVGFTQLEKKGVIDEFKRVDYKNLSSNSSINSSELNKFIGLMSQMLDKQRPSNSRLNKVLG